MPDQLVIEPGQFARARGRLAGTLEAGTLPRLADALFDTAGAVGYEVRGEVNERGRAVLHIALDGSLDLRCQRCLGRLAQQVRTRRDIVLVPDADEFVQGEDVAETEDVIPEVARLDVSALLEEELLLALPHSARHEEDVCRAEVDAPAPAGGSSPFAALARLREK